MIGSRIDRSWADSDALRADHRERPDKFSSMIAKSGCRNVGFRLVVQTGEAQQHNSGVRLALAKDQVAEILVVGEQNALLLERALADQTASDLDAVCLIVADGISGEER